MADTNYYLCDVCSEKVDRECRLRLVTGRDDYPPQSDITEFVDLCPKHQTELIVRLAKKVSGKEVHYQAQQLLKESTVKKTS